MAVCIFVCLYACPLSVASIAHSLYNHKQFYLFVFFQKFFKIEKKPVEKGQPRKTIIGMEYDETSKLFGPCNFPPNEPFIQSLNLTKGYREFNSVSCQKYFSNMKITKKL